MSNASNAMDDYLARRDITAVINLYCRAMDRIDPELGYSAWHEGGTADYGTFTGTSRDLVDYACDYSRSVVSTSHMVSNILIDLDLDGGRATSEAYVDATILAEKGDRYAVTRGRGRYLDRWSRRDGTWAIDHRVWLQDLVTTEEVDGSGPAGRRDTSDPSYGYVSGRP